VVPLVAYEDALASPGPLVGAFSVTDDDGRLTLSIYSVAQGVPRQLAIRMVPEDEKDRVARELETAGVRVGEYDEAGSHIWSRTKTQLTAWGPRGRVLDCHDEVIDLGHRTLAKREVKAVVTWAEESKVGRGLRVELQDGALVDVADETASAAITDPGYSRNELLFDSAWAGILGRRLADWIGCPLRDEI
jgi:hypothetical protein